MALGDLLMLLGAESRNVSGLFKTMLEHTFTCAHIHPYMYMYMYVHVYLHAYAVYV